MTDADGRAAAQPGRGIPTERFERVQVGSRDELRAWLAANHHRQGGVWLVTGKKAAGAVFLDRWAVLDELLCFGWIDGIRRKLDDLRTMQLITPRRQQAWAQSYKARVARLEAEGRLAEPGRAAIQQSKAAGLWDTTAAVDALLVPADLLEALRAVGDAEGWFARAAPSYRRNLLRWLGAAKGSDTRRKRIDRIVAASAAGRRLANM
jgi:uncharacterized protein YdeI (YjbR/CyaY-like superfamily)